MPKYKVKPGGMHDRALKSRHKIQVIAGGFGNGKTALACIKALQIAKDYPGCNIFMGMATYAQLNDTMRQEFYKWVPDSSVKRYPTLADNTLVFKNGSKINFRYLKQKGKTSADGQTTSNLLSATYDLAVVDQIENPEITYKDFLDLLGRLRGSTEYAGNDETMPKTGPRWLIVMANPSFNWVYHKLIKPIQIYHKTGQKTEDLIVHPDTGEPMIELYDAPTYENAHNLDPDFIKGLEAAYKGQFRDRYLGGEWGAFEGLIYPHFSMDHHMIPKSLMLSHIHEARSKGIVFEAVEGFDFGISSPSCYLIGFNDQYGRFFIIDGFYEANLTISQIVYKINEIRLKYKHFLKIYQSVLADPAIFNKTVKEHVGQDADTIAKMMKKYGEINCIPGQNAIEAGITKINGYLAVDDFYKSDLINSQRVFFIADHLLFLSDEFASYFWKTNSLGERIDVPIDRNDHGMDTIKYMTSYLPDVTTILFKSMNDLNEVLIL